MQRGVECLKTGVVMHVGTLVPGRDTGLSLGFCPVRSRAECVSGRCCERCKSVALASGSEPGSQGLSESGARRRRWRPCLGSRLAGTHREGRTALLQVAIMYGVTQATEQMKMYGLWTRPPGVLWRRWQPCMA